MEKKELEQVTRAYRLPEDMKPYGNGHINDTFVDPEHRYLLQRINTSVFENPKELMENIRNVTEFLKQKIRAEGGNPERETLTVIPTADGRDFYQTEDGRAFRVYRFVGNTITVEEGKTVENLYQAGIGFGHFQRMLSDFPVEKLHETIPDFHHTPKRLAALKEAVQKDPVGRAASVREEISFALEHEDWANVVLQGMEEGSIPVRVTHNDTKINNILFDEVTGKAICVIDLDTVMPGSLLYDFGDGLRMGGSTAAEDEPDLKLVHFDETCFEAFARGFLLEMKDTITETERKLLPFSVKLMTYECGVRFLTDYLNGDTYFKIHRPGQNLDRARNQFCLVKEIDKKEQKLLEMVSGR